jgi:glycerol uptake facilitator-like aquaporin
MNPAVTVGAFAAGPMSAGEAIGYSVGQFIGAVGGALLLRAVLGGAVTGLGMPALAHNLALGTTTLFSTTPFVTSLTAVSQVRAQRRGATSV